MVRYRSSQPLAETKIDMVACGQRGRSGRRAQASCPVARVRTGSAMRVDDNHDNWVRVRKQKRSGLDRSHVHTTGFLADHAAGLERDLPVKGCSRRGQGLAE